LKIAGHAFLGHEQRARLQILEFCDARVRDENLRILLKARGNRNGRNILSDRVEGDYSELALMKKSSLPTGSRMRLFTFGPPGDDGYNRALLLLWCRRDRLIEAVLGFGHPIGAEADLVSAAPAPPGSWQKA
jgi:hypothetical protein